MVVDVVVGVAVYLKFNIKATMLIFGFMLFGNTCFVDKDGVSSSSGSNSYCPGKYARFNFVFCIW